MKPVPLNTIVNSNWREYENWSKLLTSCWEVQIIWTKYLIWYGQWHTHTIVLCAAHAWAAMPFSHWRLSCFCSSLQFGRFLLIYDLRFQRMATALSPLRLQNGSPFFILRLNFCFSTRAQSFLKSSYLIGFCLHTFH